MARASAAPLGARYFRVAELVGYLQDLLASDPLLGDVWVSGEIAELTRSAAGHVYFTVRDDTARLPAVMFRSAARRQTLPLVPGHQALVHGEVALYEPRSTVQLVADLVLPGDAGMLQARFEALRLRLEQEGLFASGRKRALPRIPRRVGVVTSEAGAVIHDMLTVWERRYRNIEVVFAPAVVQGPEAPREIASALALLNELSVGRAKLDLIIVARGGGSPEELATYNDERVARAIFASVVPVVSAVGHEVDTTIADLVADLRAPTPSAAAEMVVPHQDDLRRELTELARRGQGAIQGRLTRSRVEVATTLQRIERRSPERLVEEQRRVIDELAGRARRAVDQRLGRARAGADAALEQLTALSPYMTLRRGYAICTRAQDGSVVIAAEQVQPTERVNLVLARGRIVGQVTERELAEDHGPKEPERA